MDLFDLKNTWNALDKQMQQSDLVDEKRVKALISGYKVGIAKGIRSIANWQKLSVGVGVITALLLLATWLLLPFLTSNQTIHLQVGAVSAFVGLSLLVGLWWDFKLFRYSARIEVDVMPVKEVIERVNCLCRWMKYEVVALVIWSVCFCGFIYWLSGCYLLPIQAQMLFFLVVIILESVLIYYLYKKKIGKSLILLKKNTEELREIEAKKT